MTTQQNPVLSVRDLSIYFDTRFGPLRAVDGITFDLAPGEILGMVGESGAGKSLTGTAITGLLERPGRIDRGEIHFEGQRIDTLSAEEMRRLRGRKIGAIFQDPLTSLNPLMTVGQQLIQTIRTHLKLGQAAARQRAIDFLAEVGIPAPEARVDQYPHQFSGGMRQRVVIALALCAKPSLVIADEPTTALDVSIQAQILDLLKKMCRDHGAAVILVTHDMGVIAETADRVAVMYSGRIVEIGLVEKVVRDPHHPYSSGLMQSIPRVGSGVERLTQIDGAMPQLTDLPGGCAFHPRCPRALSECKITQPTPVPVGSGQVACHLFQGETA
ncbi:ABC transporter ATP-binding protein [Marivita sp.]|uniref:ABC transporter ATP-binding protein n=1 Tax=Marivita sp. TaxID=2003365 RepID=UPI00321B2A3A